MRGAQVLITVRFRRGQSERARFPRDEEWSIAEEGRLTLKIRGAKPVRLNMASRIQILEKGVQAKEMKLKRSYTGVLIGGHPQPHTAFPK